MLELGEDEGQVYNVNKVRQKFMIKTRVRVRINVNCNVLVRIRFRIRVSYVHGCSDDWGQLVSD